MADPAGFAGIDPEVTGLTADSRAVRPGWLFAALPGLSHDGRAFIADAVTRGAVAVLAPPGTALPAGAQRAADGRAVVLLADADPRRRLAQMAAAFFAPQPRIVCAVTGTNGKTSVAWFTRHIWQALDHPAAAVGTLGIIVDGFAPGGGLTTPDAVTLHRDLAELKIRGIDHVAVEASSHGLYQRRLDGVRLAAAAFTNLTRDHLDYHASFAEYRAAKTRLFDTVLASGATAVLNADSEEFTHLAELCRNRGIRVIGYGAAGGDIRLTGIAARAESQTLDIAIAGESHRVDLPVIGAFQASNALAALGLAMATGADGAAAAAALATVSGVPGRLQRVARAVNGAPVFVDYAHTPDALDTVLKAVRPHVKGRLVLVFGCGGDRDAGKRPMMGAIAARRADVAIVTDDNPRGEDPAAIRAAIRAACPDAREIGDRAEAIAAGVTALGPDDALVIAGKGHESGQIVGGETRPFSDAAVARTAVAAAGASA